MSIKSKLLLYFLGLIIVPSSFFGFLTYSSTRQHLIHEIENHLLSLASAQESRIQEVRNKYNVILKGIVSRTKFRNELQRLHSLDTHALSKFASTTPATLFEEKQTILSSISRILDDAIVPITEVQSATVFSTDGIPYVSINSKEDEVSLNETVINAAKKENVFTTESIKGRTSIFIVSPIKKNGVTYAYIKIGFSVKPFAIVSDDYTGLGSTGETLVAFRTKKGDAEFLAPTRYGGASKILSVQTDAPMTQALNQKEVILRNAIDYRGQEVLAVTRYIDSMDLGVVTKIDTKEAFRSLTSLTTSIVIVIVIITLFGMFLAFIVARNIAKPIQLLTRETKKSKSGDFNFNIPDELKDTKDEFANLAESFSIMGEEIQKYNASLEKKVAERTKELSEKMEELKQVNDMMIGREIKMSELKRRLESVEKS